MAKGHLFFPYGMGEIDSLHYKVCRNKVELVHTHSKATGLVNLTILFILWMVFRHILILVRGYGGDVNMSTKKMVQFTRFYLFPNCPRNHVITGTNKFL